MSKKRLNASQAAARLGVKKATLYAYVSRGLLRRYSAEDGRRSLFSSSEVDALRTDRRRSAKGELNTVIASSITRLDEAGHSYRDIPVADLIEEGRSFEAVADHLWQQQYIPEQWAIPAPLKRELRSVAEALSPAMPALDRLRIALSVASASDSLRSAAGDAKYSESGRRLLQSMVYSLSRRSSTSKSIVLGLWEGVVTNARLSDSRNSPKRLRALEVALILLADHGLASSTFGVRVAASVRADPYSIVATGLGTMAGILHGGAPSRVVLLLERAHAHGVEFAVNERLASGEPLPGLGHKIYEKKDPREELLFGYVRDAWADSPRSATLLSLRNVLSRQSELPANIDFALGAMAWLAGFKSGGVAVFAVARVAGWLAHAMEEMREEPLRFRPTARYVV